MRPRWGGLGSSWLRRRLVRVVSADGAAHEQVLQSLSPRDDFDNACAGTQRGAKNLGDIRVPFDVDVQVLALAVVGKAVGRQLRGQALGDVTQRDFDAADVGAQKLADTA